MTESGRSVGAIRSIAGLFSGCQRFCAERAWRRGQLSAVTNCYRELRVYSVLDIEGKAGPVTLSGERDQVSALFARLDDIETVAASFTADDPRRVTLCGVVDSELACAEPIRPRVAAELLSLNEKTIRAWVAEGVLTTAHVQPRLLLDAASVHRVIRLVRDLRQAGTTRGLLDEVFRRLQDGAVRERPDLQESLAQMARGEGTVVRGPADQL